MIHEFDTPSFLSLVLICMVCSIVHCIMYVHSNEMGSMSQQVENMYKTPVLGRWEHGEGAIVNH